VSFVALSERGVIHSYIVHNLSRMMLNLQDFFAPAYLESSMRNIEVQHTNKDTSDLSGENLFV
jgi:uncharacterized OB-fold protein